MFTNQTFEAVNFSSSWKGKRELKDNTVQTDAFSTFQRETQNPEIQSVQVQTEEEVTWSSENYPEYNVFVLLAFLQRVEPDVTNQLQRNLGSKAFQRYQLIADLDSQDTQRLNELQNPHWSEQFQCTAIAWSPTVSVLALGYGCSSHESWCDHEAGVSLWNLDRDILNNKVPQNSIEMDGCVTALAFHLKIPSCLAAGKISGDVCILNTAPDETVSVVSVKDNLDCHREPITALNWIPDPSNAKRILLMSASLDGKILLWNFAEQKLTVVDGFILLSQHLPRSLRVKNTNAEVGVTCLSINSEDPSLFVVGTEGGALFQCSLHSQAVTGYGLSDGTPLKSPVGMTFALHSGYVSSVHFSPHTRNIFLSCDSNGELRISTLLQPQPLLTIQLASGLSCAQWSPICPLNMGVVTMDGQMHLFDLSLKQTGPFASFPLGNEKNQLPATTLRFNSAKASLLATASQNGCAQVWSLGSKMTSANKGDLNDLLSLGSTQANS